MRQDSLHKKRTKKFTVVELMIVIAIIVILAAIAAPHLHMLGAW